ncbi:C40 family peptidase [Deinococcus yavapaiensis]|uniref:Cell wall-associated NlpC family hydrolase n=1 Tax=Deinococcus yavapaiensis KR-236 TaxID=694435 RepID=A0A318SF07_9DEIO|nr:C40 family peptidase [Deinococcus yavapaiensis]PYE55282.1 cell wall-associated NlpC family hydrolase [Deinococcus yavapaiensis KR-236]
MQAIRVLFLALGLLGVSASAETYVVKAGDTLSNVARKFNTDPVQLMRTNGLSSSTIQIGQKLQVPGAAKSTQPANTIPMASKSGTSDRTGVVRAAAMRFMGIRYRLGALGAGGIDCSAFTQAVLRQMGVQLPRTARQQFAVGTPVTKSDLRAGDLVFFNTLGNGVSHVGVYLGGGQFAHANSYQGRTVVEDINQMYYRYRYVGARRVLPGS